MSIEIPTVQFASVVYDTEVPLDDPAESFHEATRLYPSTAGRQARRIELLSRRRELQRSASRASRLHPHRPQTTLPAPSWPNTTLAQAITGRRSRLPEPESTLGVADLSQILAGAYGVTVENVHRRHVPSGGALYPLELYPLALHVDGVAAGIYHYAPYGHRLERLADLDLEHLSTALVDTTIPRNAALLVAISGMFWRSRFKYGQRGYKFALLEAGHVAQNALLLAAARGIDAAPLGGYYDAALDTFLGLDGVDESIVYLLAFGRSASGAG